jgi:hypothetical protein
MPAQAKLGLVLGLGATIAVAIFFQPKEKPIPYSNHAAIASAPVAKEVQGQTTSNRK